MSDAGPKRPRFAKLSVQFFIHYMLLFLLLVCVGAAGAAGSFAYIYSHLDLDALNFDIAAIHQTAAEQGAEAAFLSAGLPEGSYLELLNEELVVTGQYGSPHPEGYRYRQSLFNRLLISYAPEYSFYYPDDSDTILMVVTPAFRRSMDFMRMLLIAAGAVLSLLILAVLVYSRVTSVVFLKPVTALLTGVHRIRDGDYGTRIRFRSRNELDELKTAINQMAERIEQETELRERAEKNQKRLILDISHDLKTPLTNIQGYTETLLQGPPADWDTLRQHLEIIFNNSRRANSVLKDLFDLARLENSLNEPELQVTDICEFLRLTLGSYVQELEANAMAYDFRIPDREWPVRLNQSLMERAVGNLLINGIKYAGPGTTLRVRLTRSRQGSVCITIEDNGPGIVAGDRDRLFQPFYRADASRSSRTGGTGLGLAISRAIVEKHRGTLQLDPDYGPGCRFTIMLPCLCTDVPDTPK